LTSVHNDVTFSLHFSAPLTLVGFGQI